MENQLTALERKIDELLASVDEQADSTQAKAVDAKRGGEQGAKD